MMAPLALSTAAVFTALIAVSKRVSPVALLAIGFSLASLLVLCAYSMAGESWYLLLIPASLGLHMLCQAVEGREQAPE
jgi:hypothetical protein